jgi:hypothetical protein
LEGETHRHVPSDMAMHAKNFVLVYVLICSRNVGVLTAMLQGYRSRTR